MLKEEYPGDLLVLNILLEIFSDDELCKNRLIVEIKLHQQQKNGGTKLSFLRKISQMLKPPSSHEATGLHQNRGAC